MKNNIKKAPVKFQEDLLYFQHFCADFCLCPKLMIITTLRRLLVALDSRLVVGWNQSAWADSVDPNLTA